MTTHMTGTRQWLKARRELLKTEKDLTRRSDKPRKFIYDFSASY